MKKIIAILVAMSQLAFANQNFEYAVTKLIKFEGGNKIDKNIKNAYSKFGITKYTLNRYDKSLNLYDLTESQAKNIIYKLYWEEYDLDMFTDKRNAMLVLDFIYNSNSDNAVKIIQKSLGNKVYKKLTIQDIAEINYMGYKSFYKIYSKSRLDYMKSLKNYNKFKTGWNIRVEELGGL